MIDAVRRFESALPELRLLLTSRHTDATELMLVGEMRRVMGELAGTLAVAAEIGGDLALERLARRAWMVAAAGRSRNVEC